MYWIWLFSNFLYWSSNILNDIDSSINVDLIWFNSYDFSDIVISNIPSCYDNNSFDLHTYELSTHGQWLSNWLIRDKTLTINWWILAENERDLELKIKKIKSCLLVWNWTLYINSKNWILQTNAVVSKLDIPRQSWTINSVEISITFKVLDPFFYSLKMNEVWFFDVNSNLTATLLYTWWTHCAKPSVFISFKEAEFVNEIVVTLNWKKLIVSQKLNTWDSLSINSEKLDVARNWKYWIDWLWEFWELNTWENEINVSINWGFNTEIFVKWRDVYV